MPMFDATAADFDRHRAFPEGVAEAIRGAVWTASRQKSGARVLDLGAGTGRIGRAFAAAGDEYFGVDLSLAMLREFRNIKTESAPRLTQADGRALPFMGHSFGVVMLMQVLSGTSEWQPILSEACRVVQPGGVIVTGRTVMPEDGIDQQLKMRLREILEEWNIASHGGVRNRKEALAWLETRATGSARQIAATWIAGRSPRQFLERHKTGARFSALPGKIQEKAVEQLSGWAEKKFGPLDAALREQHCFELEIFEF